MDEKPKLYKLYGVWWQFETRPQHVSDVSGPFCSRCYVSLDLDQDKLVCANCKKTTLSPGSSWDTIMRRALDKYWAVQRSKYDKISLDEPPALVKVRDEDENYFIAARIGQKDGKRVGVVYFGEREDRESDKAQVFVDLDDQQIRFDPSNTPPKRLLSKLTVEFRDTKSVNEYVKHPRSADKEIISVIT